MSQFAKAIINGTVSINKTGVKERKTWGGIEYFGLGITVRGDATELSPQGRFVTRCNIKVTDKNLLDKLVSMDGKQVELIGELKSEDLAKKIPANELAPGQKQPIDFVQFLFVEEVK